MERTLGCDVRYPRFGLTGSLVVRPTEISLRPSRLTRAKSAPILTQRVSTIEVVVARWNPLAGVVVFVSEGGWTGAAIFSRVELDQVVGALEQSGISVTIRRTRLARHMERLAQPLDGEG